MEGTTLEAGRRRGAGEERLSRRERIGAWLYTGAPGRLFSFAVDLTLSLAALAIYATRRAWGWLRRPQRPAA